MQLSLSGVWQWNELATKPNEPSVNIVPLSPKTDSWHEDSRPSGRNACAISPLQKPNSNGGNDYAHARRAKKKKRKFSLSAPICIKSGRRPPPRIEIAKSCCALFWKK